MIEVCGSAPSPGLGRFYLKNSSGATVASITDGWAGTPAWQSVAVTLPASASEKYDLMMDNNSGDTLSLYAATAWEEDA